MYHILNQQEVNPWFLLNLEKHVFSNPAWSAMTKEHLKPGNYLERLDTDLSEWIELSVAAILQNLEEIKDLMSGMVKKKMNYDKLTIRQKNNLNYWLDYGFYLHKPKLSKLTSRQHEIILLLLRYGHLSNKDLVPIFKVDRKTIQRDFNELLSLQMVEQRGAGRGLEYYLDFKVYLN
jgi:hypothetical protein